MVSKFFVQNIMGSGYQEFGLYQEFPSVLFAPRDIIYVLIIVKNFKANCSATRNKFCNKAEPELCSACEACWVLSYLLNTLGTPVKLSTNLRNGH